MGTTARLSAFVMSRIGEVGMAEKPIPEPGATGAVVKTTTALVCTSDVHTVEGAIGGTSRSATKRWASSTASATRSAACAKATASP